MQNCRGDDISLTVILRCMDGNNDPLVIEQTRTLDNMTRNKVLQSITSEDLLFNKK